MAKQKYFARTAAAAAALLWLASPTLTATELPISGFSKNVQGTGRLGLDLRNAGAFYIQNMIDKDQPTRSLQVQSQESFTGCMAGDTPSRCASVEAHATGYFYNALGPNVMTTESALSATAQNGANKFPAQAVGLSAIGIANQSNSTETWGLIPAVYDMDFNGSPTSGRVAMEVDNYGLGEDPHRNRIGIDLVLGSPTGIIPPKPGVFEAALRIGATNGDVRYGAWRQGIVLQQRFLTSILDMSHATSDRDQIVGVGNNWKVDAAGRIEALSFAAKLMTPVSSHAPCKVGQFADDARYHYVCIAQDHWRRVALSDF